MKLGAKLKKLRKNAGLSQAEIAQKLGVSRQAISNWETNRKGLSLERAVSITETFEITPNDLLEVKKEAVDARHKKGPGE